MQGHIYPTSRFTMYPFEYWIGAAQLLTQAATVTTSHQKEHSGGVKPTSAFLCVLCDYDPRYSRQWSGAVPRLHHYAIWTNSWQARSIYRNDRVSRNGFLNGGRANGAA